MTISKEDRLAVENDTAEFLGEGPWEKNAAYQVYKVEDRYIAVVVSDWSAKWLEWDIAEYITKEQVENYI